jgi:hypothetical protein
MTPTQIATPLAYISSIDGRHTSTLMAEAWSDLIGGLDFEDAKSAVKDHYRDSADWLKPAHIVAGVKRIRAARIREVERHVLDGHLTLRPADYGTPAEEVKAMRRLRGWVASGRMGVREYVDYHGGTHVLAAGAKALAS